MAPAGAAAASKAAAQVAARTILRMDSSFRKKLPGAAEHIGRRRPLRQFKVIA
jgi:hypothetical protein